jgi:hypothetical protein
MQKAIEHMVSFFDTRHQSMRLPSGKFVERHRSGGGTTWEGSFGLNFMLWPLVTIAPERMELTKKSAPRSRGIAKQSVAQKILKFKACQEHLT